MGDTIGLAYKYSRYYAGGPISYKETDVNPLVAFYWKELYTGITFGYKQNSLGAEARWKQY